MNCGENQSASYRGCEVAKKIQKIRNKAIQFEVNIKSKELEMQTPMLKRAKHMLKQLEQKQLLANHAKQQLMAKFDDDE